MSDANSWQIRKVCLCSAADFPRGTWNNSANPAASSITERRYDSVLMYIFVSVPVGEALYIFNYCTACVVMLNSVTPGIWSVDADRGVLLWHDWASSGSSSICLLLLYIFVLGYLLSAFNHELCAAFSAFSLTNPKVSVWKIVVENCSLVSIDEDLWRPSGSQGADKLYRVCMQTSFIAFLLCCRDKICLSLLLFGSVIFSAVWWENYQSLTKA